jgi:hypothetical protein
MFEYFFVPPSLPYAAFRVSHFWDRAAMQWTALSNHGWLCEQLENDIELHRGIIESVEETHGGYPGAVLRRSTMVLRRSTEAPG